MLYTIGIISALMLSTALPQEATAESTIQSTISDSHEEHKSILKLKAEKSAIEARISEIEAKELSLNHNKAKEAQVNIDNKSKAAWAAKLADEKNKADARKIASDKRKQQHQVWVSEQESKWQKILSHRVSKTTSEKRKGFIMKRDALKNHE